MTAIKQLRTKCGLTQKQLAAIVGRSENTVKAWERGKYRPSDEIFPKLAEALGCNVAAIWIPPKKVRRPPHPPHERSAEELAAEAANREKVAPYVERRQALGLTQKDLAARAGVTVSTICNMEGGRYTPCWETRQKLRRALGMPEERLYTEEERNEIFFQLGEFGIIRRAVHKKREKLRVAHVDLEDLYQELSLCILRAIDRYQPDGTATLKTFVERNVDFFIDRWVVKYCMHGLSGKIHYPLPDVSVVSLNALMENGFDPIG